MIFRFLTSGESHGKCLNAIIEGVPAGVNIDIDFINSELAKRQKGYGRGGRMNIETDKAEILSGVRFGYSTGAPIAIVIKNKDWANWQIPMSVKDVEQSDENVKLIEEKTIKNVRPGHADYAGALKYNQQDIRNILERSSARETAMRVAVGAIAKLILKEFNIFGISYVMQIGNVCAQDVNNPFEYSDIIENSELRCFDKAAEDKMKAEIDRAKKEGDTLGGLIKVVYKGMPVGLGSHVHWDRKLDGQLAQAVMSIPAVKSVEIGLGKDCANISGFNTHDEIFINESGHYYRKTNNAGGIEGGMTNGEDVVITAAMKAIPTMIKPLNSVALDIKENVKAHFERSDTCAVSACAVVTEAMCAVVLANAMLEKFSHDSIEEMKNNYNSYIKRISER